jgi:hypothetical protein
MGFKNRDGRWLAALFLAVILVGPPWAVPCSIWTRTNNRWRCRIGGDAWTDTTGEAIVDKVATDRTIAWAPTRQGEIYPLTTGKALWIRFTVPPAPDAERWYLEIPYPSVNRVTLYTPDSTGQWVWAIRRRHFARGRLARAPPLSLATRRRLRGGAPENTC